jgi:hypothetical protein
LGKKTWNGDGIKKCRLVKKAQNIGLNDTAFEELVEYESFLET